MIDQSTDSPCTCFLTLLCPPWTVSPPHWVSHYGSVGHSRFSMSTGLDELCQMKLQYHRKNSRTAASDWFNFFFFFLQHGFESVLSLTIAGGTWGCSTRSKPALALLSVTLSQLWFSSNFLLLLFSLCFWFFLGGEEGKILLSHVPFYFCIILPLT